MSSGHFTAEWQKAKQYHKRILKSSEIIETELLLGKRLLQPCIDECRTAAHMFPVGNNKSPGRQNVV